METPTEVRDRWIYLRDLLLEQLGRLESGLLQVQTAGLDVSPDAIARLKKSIAEFDTLISRSQAREARDSERDPSID